jgi:S1-C subfamily serine protease
VTKFEPARTLGFLGTELTAEQAGEIGLQDGRVGIRVTQVIPDGVGVKAGLAVGDVIISFDTKIFDDEPLNQLRSWMQAIPYGRRVKVVVRREGKDVDLWVTWEPPKKP